MSGEIKEIINQLEIVARKHTIQVCEDDSKIETMPASAIDELRLNNYSSKLLLDYITNLQKIEGEYSSLLSENAELQQKYDKALSDLVKESHKRMELSKNYDRLNNIIDELEKYIGQEWYCFDNESIEFKVARDILNKLKELKENNNE